MSSQHEQQHDPVDIELDLSTFTADELEGDGSPPPGKYHARIEDCQRVSDKTSYLKLRLSLLAGTNPAGVGCVFSERFYLSDAAKKRLAILAHRLKLVADNDFGSRVNIDWAKVIGKQLVVQVIEEEFETKKGEKAKGAKLAFGGFWDLGDERVKDVPRDEAAQRQATQQRQATRAPAAASQSTDNVHKTPFEDDWESI
jgi:hypothetical protein